MSVIGHHDWNLPGDLQEWTESQSWVSISNPDTGGIDDSGYLRISLDPTDPFPSEEWTSVVGVNSSSLFAGNWTPGMGIHFAFMADEYSPGALQLRWQGSSGFTWRYVLDAPATGQWTAMDAPLRNWRDWAFPGATEEMYLSDLASMNWIGVYIYRNTEMGQSYGLDDFNLVIPEPGEVVMLGATMGVMLLAFRRRIRWPWRRASAVSAGS